jgi:acylphosphatase
VQGVGFRYHTCREANRLELTGYIKNRCNGDVEVVASGSQLQLATFYDWLMVGPSLATVNNLSEKKITFENHQGFSIKY